MDALTTVQTLCEASATPHRAAATCAKAMLGVINNQDEIRADETLRASAQDACIALVHSCRGASRWGALRALSVLGLCSAEQTSNLSVALLRNDEALDPRALRVLVAVLPAESGAEHAFLDFCLSTSKAHLTEAVRQLLELRNDQGAGGAANLAMRLFKSGFLDLLASDQTDDAQENVARAETVSLLLSALGFWWKPSKTSFATDQVPRSFDADFLVNTVLALPVKASSAALCCGVLALHIGFSAQDRSDEDFIFMEDQTASSQIVRKIFERLRKISVAESESSEASQESLELWLWPLLCLLRTLASYDAPAAAAIAVGLPFSSRLPLHVQHWACAALSLTSRPRGQVQEWALKISRNETWFCGTERDARALAKAALSARHFCIATGLEIAFPHTVLAPETWLAAFAQNEELQAHTSVEMLGLLAILNFKGGLRTKLVFPLAMITKEVPWQLRTAHLILIASLGTQAQLPTWDPIVSALFDSPHVQVREAACACACQCRPKDEAMRFGVLTNSASPWARVVCLTSPQDGWTHFVKRALDPPFEFEPVSASSTKHARPQFVIVPGVLSESFDLLLQWYPQEIN